MTRLTILDLGRACGLTVHHGPDGRPRFSGPPQARPLVDALNDLARRHGGRGPARQSAKIVLAEETTSR